MAAKTQKSGVTTMETRKSSVITVDITDNQILEYNKVEGMRLSWDPYSFRALPDEVVVALTEENREAYYKAKLQADERAREAARIAERDLEVMSPLAMNASYRLEIRPRRGWHQCWKSPGVDFDSAMAGPYKQVRVQKDGEKQEPGYENGEVLKLLDGEGKVELIAVECPQDLYDKHLEAMARKSSRMLVGAKEDFFRATEEINRRQGNRNARITAIDESGDLQA